MARKTPRPSTRPAPRKTTSTFTRKYARMILKPLGRKETAAAVERALEAVLRDGDVRRERVRIYGPFLRIEKPKRRHGPPTRLIWVRLRDRDRGVVHEVTVQAGKVVDYAKNADATPPFSDEERDEARRLISNDPVLGELLARKDVEIEWFNPAGHGRGRVIGARLVRLKNHQVIEGITEAEVALDEGVLHERSGHR